MFCLERWYINIARCGPHRLPRAGRESEKQHNDHVLRFVTHQVRSTVRQAAVAACRGRHLPVDMPNTDPSERFKTDLTPAQRNSLAASMTLACLHRTFASSKESFVNCHHEAKGKMS